MEYHDIVKGDKLTKQFLGQDQHSKQLIKDRYYAKHGMESFNVIISLKECIVKEELTDVDSINVVGMIYGHGPTNQKKVDFYSGANETPEVREEYEADLKEMKKFYKAEFIPLLQRDGLNPYYMVRHYVYKGVDIFLEDRYYSSYTFFSVAHSDIYHYVGDEDVVKEFIDANLYLDLTRENDDNTIYTIQSNQGEFQLEDLMLENVTRETVMDNYNPDMVAFIDPLVESLNDNDTGLYLYHGEPGTGKTSLIKYLAGQVKQRDIIYIPMIEAGFMASSKFVSLMRRYKNPILVVEDAEDILKQGSPRSPATSGLLNLADGLLTKQSNIAILATFNCDLKLLDKALTRVGRLKFRYRFGVLEQPVAEKLAKKLGFDDYTYTDSDTLADVYNYNDTNYEDIESKIGFYS